MVSFIEWLNREDNRYADRVSNQELSSADAIAGAGLKGGEYVPVKARTRRNGPPTPAKRVRRVTPGGIERRREGAPAHPREQLITRLLDPTLTLEETAKVLNVCPATVRRYTNRGELPHFRTNGNQRRFRLSEVLDFMRSNQGGSTLGSGPSKAASDELVAAGHEGEAE